MPKGYWIAHVSISDSDSYKAYVTANAKAFSKFGARFCVRAGQNTVVEGEFRGDRHVMIEFPSYQAALDCYHSPEYAEAKAIRASASQGDLIIIEGYDGAQPGD